MPIALAAIFATVQLAISVETERPSPSDTVPLTAPAAAEVDSATMASAYADAWSREMIQLARARQDTSERAILAYSALARQRISVGLSTLRRERLLYRRESAAKIHWRRYGRLEVDLLGSREVIPPALPGMRVPDDLESTIPLFLFDPANTSFVLGGSSQNRNDGLRHPLSPGSEAHYRFARGDSTVITLPDGRSVRLVEVRLTPRRAAPQLLSGSLWFDVERHALVQGVFRLARAFDLERDGDAKDRRDIRWLPGFLKPIRADLRYLTIDYGLWEMRWWLPRAVALEGYAEAGSLLRVPIRFELSYSDYDIFEDPVRLPLGLPTPVVAMTLNGDTVPGYRCRRSYCRCFRGDCRPVDLRIPDDTTLLLTHPSLPPSVYSDGLELVDEAEIRAALARLSYATSPTDLVGPRLYWGLDKPGLTRYNRVEGLSTGVMLGVEYGGLSADLTARMAWSDRRNPGVTFGLRREGPTYHTRFGAYREVAAIDPAVEPFALANTLSSLVWARDEGDYYRALGVEVAGGPAPGRSVRLDWRVYAERQHPLEQKTRASLRRLWDRENHFRPNLRADSADLVGASVALRLARGFDPLAFRWGGELSLDGAVGSYRFVRPGISLGVSGRLPRRLVGLLEGAAGTTFGEAPVQKAWFLGGTPTLRGYAPIAVAGESFWRARAELGNRFPAGRIVVFSDLGWAGSWESFPGARPLVSAGVGGSLLDGMIRLDLARALRSPTGWRLTLSSDLAL